MKNSEGKIQGGHLLAKSMAAKGIKRVFALAGGFVNPIYDGCLEYGIEIVGTRSEQEAGFLADGWARLNREPSVCIAEPSGFTNYISAVAEAYHAGDPVIFISAASIFHRLDRMGFKETPQHRVVEGMTKYSVLVNDGARIPEFFDKAYDIAINQPTGPVELSIPINFLFSRKYEIATKENERPFDLSKMKVHKPSPHPDDVALVLKMLREARRPVIIAGPGVWRGRAEKELEDFSSEARIPVFMPPWHIKMYDLAHYFNMGLADIHQNPVSRLIYQESDVVLFIGCKLDYTLDFGEPPLFNKSTKLITVNFSSRELAENHIADIPILSDLKLFLSELTQKAGTLNVDPDWVERIRLGRKENNEKWSADATSSEMPIHPLRVCMDVLHSLGEEDYVVIDGGDIYSWFEAALNIWAMEGGKIKKVLHSGPFDQLGIGISLAAVAKMKSPKSNVVLISGDGAFGLAPGLPMETAIHYELPLTVVVTNNQQWGMIQEQQKAIWGRSYKTNLREVPYYKMVEGTGGYGQLVKDPRDLKTALERSFASKVPSLIDVRTKSVASPVTEGLIDRRERSSIE